MPDKVSVLIVDDSATIRMVLKRLLSQEEEIEVIGQAEDGVEAVEQHAALRPDVILLDINMPRMDGIETVEKLKAIDPHAKILICSSFSDRSAKNTIEALRCGALDYIVKPSSLSDQDRVAFANELAEKIMKLMRVVVPGRWKQAEPGVAAPTASSSLLPYPKFLGASFPKAIFIGSSTGGPAALIELFSAIEKKNVRCPIFITQHIPAGFSKPMAESLSFRTGFNVVEASEGLKVSSNTVYLAPGGKHMILDKESGCIKLDDGPQVNYSKPSLNVTLDSLAEVYTDNLLCIFLTGMGADGTDACERLLNNDNQNVVFVQDEQSSVVWGIPGSVHKKGLAHYVGNLDGIAQKLNGIL